MARRRVAISGLGSIGRQHARAFAPLRDVERIGFDPFPRSRDAARADGLIEDAVDDYAALLATEPDAVVIATPDAHHLPQLEAAARAGIPALVEKPLAPSFADAVAAGSRLAPFTTPVLVGYVLRHRRAVAAARRFVTEGAIGEPVSFQVMLGARGTLQVAASRFAEPEPDRLYRDYSHEWDYLRWILGPITTVTAVARTVPGPSAGESPNAVDALLELASGVTGAVHLDYVEPRGVRTLHIVGDAGSLFVDIARGTLLIRAEGDEGEYHVDLTESPAEPLARQAEHLMAVAAGQESPRATYRDGLQALAVTDAVIEAARQRAWVAVADA